MDVCECAGHLAANQVGYHLFHRRVGRAVLPCTRSHGIGFMAYGTLGFGLLTGAFNESTTFVDWDWGGARGYAFGLPLFPREQFLKQLRVVERLRPSPGNRHHLRRRGRPHARRNRPDHQAVPAGPLIGVTPGTRPALAGRQSQVNITLPVRPMANRSNASCACDSGKRWVTRLAKRRPVRCMSRISS